jgi:hypothetical protein
MGWGVRTHRTVRPADTFCHRCFAWWLINPPAPAPPAVQPQGPDSSPTNAASGPIMPSPLNPPHHLPAKPDLSPANLDILLILTYITRCASRTPASQQTVTPRRAPRLQEPNHQFNKVCSRLALTLCARGPSGFQSEAFHRGPQRWPSDPARSASPRATDVSVACVMLDRVAGGASDVSSELAKLAASLLRGGGSLLLLRQDALCWPGLAPAGSSPPYRSDREIRYRALPISGSP